VPRRRFDEAGGHEVRTELGDLVHVGAEHPGDVLGAVARGLLLLALRTPGSGFRSLR